MTVNQNKATQETGIDYLSKMERQTDRQRRTRLATRGRNEWREREREGEGKRRRGT